MRRIAQIWIVLFFTCLGSVPAMAQFYYGLHQNYGKNRVEFREFEWVFYRYERFDVFFYDQGREISQQVARMVSRQIPIAESNLDITLDERIQVMVFNTLTDLKQSNLNANTDEAYNTGGVVHFDGNKVFVYFDGDYTHLESQVKEGLTGLAMSKMLYGGFTASIRNSTLLSLPEWYTEGLLAYYAYPYSSEVENFVMDGMAHDEYRHLYALSGEKARMAGHSIWHYIAETYGHNLIKNVLFTTVSARSVDKGLQYTIGVNSEQLIANWHAYYAERYQERWNDELVEDFELRRGRTNEELERPVFSPDGSHLAYVSNRLGRFRVNVLDVDRNRRRTVLRGGHAVPQNADFSYPLMAWHPNGKILAIVSEDHGLSWLYFYNTEDGTLEKREFYLFQKVLSIQYSRDGQSFLLSAVKNGQSDVFLYTIRSRSVDALTNDGYSDLDPIFTNDDRFIVFRSNRSDDTLRSREKVYIHPSHFDLFIYRRDKGNDQVLWRLQTPDGEEEYNLRPLDRSHFSYMSSSIGPPTEYVVRLDSSIAYVDTATHYNYSVALGENENYSYGSMYHDINLSTYKQVRVYLRDGRYRLAVTDFDWPSEFSKSRSSSIPGDGFPTDEPGEIAQIREVQEVDIHNYIFEPEALALIRPATSPVLQTTRLAVNNDSLFGESFPIPTMRNYFLTFQRDNFSLSVDNVFDYPQYQPFTGVVGGSLINTGFNALMKVGVLDILNDYRVVGGFRTDFQPLPGVSLSPNSELFLGVLNSKYRLNQETTLYRRSQVSYLSSYNLNVRYITYELHHKFSYPFSQVDGLRFSVGYRNQRQLILVDNAAAVAPLEVDPIQITDYGIVKLEYVFDNTRKKGVNLYHGTRYKIFSEYYENFSKSNSGMVTLGIDYRKYVPVHREIIWANRFAFGTSLGNERLLHYLGGVDNEFSPGFTNNTPFATNVNYTFQTVVTNMRGFYQNIRNGNSFAVINSELRVPIVRYLYNGPVQNDFLANFQIIGFGDIGTAWNGLQPYSPENAINTRIVNGVGYTAYVDTQREPIVGGMGFGIRSRLLGYFMRLDWAWGVEDGRVLDHVVYFSLSTDF